MSHVFPRHSQSTPPVVVRGEGCYMVDASGKRYLDGSGGRRFPASAMATWRFPALSRLSLTQLLLPIRDFSPANQPKSWPIY